MKKILVSLAIIIISTSLIHLRAQTSSCVEVSTYNCGYNTCLECEECSGPGVNLGTVNTWWVCKKLVEDTGKITITAGNTTTTADICIDATGCDSCKGYCIKCITSTTSTPTYSNAFCSAVAAADVTTLDEAKATQSTSTTTTKGLVNLSAIKYEAIVASIYSFLFPIGIIIGAGSIIIAGYKFLTSEGNPQMVADAKDNLSSAVIGTLFIILALALLRIIIKTTFNIEI